jgi:hypothetical protein
LFYGIFVRSAHIDISKLELHLLKGRIKIICARWTALTRNAESVLFCLKVYSMKVFFRILCCWISILWLVNMPGPSYSADSDPASHRSDHEEDAQVETLPTVHVHGLRLNKNQQLGPVPQRTPWPAIPASLDGQVLDDWLKARILVSKDLEVTVVILQPAEHRELTQASLQALKQWTFLPQMKGDTPIDGEVSLRIHFRTK